MLTTHRAERVAWLCIAVITAAGCGRSTESVAKTALPPATASQNSDSARHDGPAPLSSKRDSPDPVALASDWPIVSAAAIDASRVGLVVCEPRTASADPAWVGFGAGSARWLQFTVGGLPELALTPTWTAIDRGRRELHLSGLQCDARQSVDLAARVGATNTVVCELTGTPSDAALTLAPLDVKRKARLGAAITLRGSLQRIVEQLPQAGSDLAKRLGIKRSIRSDSGKLSSDEITLLGAVPWRPDIDLDKGQRTRLEALAPRVGLAAMLALGASDDTDRKHCDLLGRQAVAAAPDNACLFGGLAYMDSRNCISQKAALSTLRKRYPSNFQLAVADLFRLRLEAAPAEAMLARSLPKLAPANPEAWLSAGYTVSTLSERIRNGRFSSQISPSEYGSLNRLYFEWLTDVKHATELDPDFAHAWGRLASAATFAGDSDLADTAMKNALRLDPTDDDTIFWGLQMYQPKWLSRPDELVRVARVAAEACHWDSRVYKMAKQLEYAGQNDEARAIRTEALKRERDAVASHPQDFHAAWSLAWGLKESGLYREANREFRDLKKRFPVEVALRPLWHRGTGNCCIELGRTHEAAAELQAAARAYPGDPLLLRELAYAYRMDHQPLKAIDVFLAADKLDNGTANAYGMLGDAYLDANRPADAVTSYRRSVALDPKDAVNWRNLSIALGRVRQFAEGVKAAERALAIAPDDVEAHQSLSYLYAENHQLDKSAAESRLVLRSNANDATAHANLGDVLADMGKLQEAKGEWDAAIRLDPNGPAGKDARENMARHHLKDR